MKIKDMAAIVQDSLAEQLGMDEVAKLAISSSVLQKALTDLFTEIKSSSRFNPVYIRDFGTFRTKHRPSRVINNSLTKNQPVFVHAKDVPLFSPAKAYKDMVSAPKQ
jgi:nucleoid DNA-binding protein